MKEQTADTFVQTLIEGYRDVPRFLALCRQCPRYGKVWTCPPFETNSTLHSQHSRLKLYAFTLEAGEDVDEALVAIDARMRALERNTPGSRCMVVRCVLCGKQPCSRVNGEPCRHPSMMRVSLEAMGFDVEAIARDFLGIELQWGEGAPLTFVTALFY